ncbi:hypothetical protein EMIT0324P_11064 [Pseudomonas chlororaphis]
MQSCVCVEHAVIAALAFLDAGGKAVNKFWHRGYLAGRLRPE